MEIPPVLQDQSDQAVAEQLVEQSLREPQYNLREFLAFSDAASLPTFHQMDNSRRRMADFGIGRRHPPLDDSEMREFVGGTRTSTRTRPLAPWNFSAARRDEQDRHLNYGTAQLHDTGPTINFKGETERRSLATEIYRSENFQIQRLKEKRAREIKRRASTGPLEDTKKEPTRKANKEKGKGNRKSTSGPSSNAKTIRQPSLSAAASSSVAVAIPA